MGKKSLVPQQKTHTNENSFQTTYIDWLQKINNILANKENQNKTSLLLPVTVNGSLRESIQEQQHKVSFTKLSYNLNSSREWEPPAKQKETTQNPNKTKPKAFNRQENTAMHKSFSFILQSCICFSPVYQAAVFFKKLHDFAFQ